VRDDGFEQRLQQWMEGLPGVTERRRVVRRDGARVLVSKFEEGFAAHLHDVLDRLPELFDVAFTAEAYAKAAREHPEAPRALVWRVSIGRTLRALAEERGLTQDDVTNVGGGLDSVAALLDSVLWTSPLAGDAGYAPAPGECEAYGDAAGRMDTDAPIFMRVYGEFEGAQVVNYCPAPLFGRRLFNQAWSICTSAT
jgi:hypothetical protein